MTARIGVSVDGDLMKDAAELFRQAIRHHYGLNGVTKDVANAFKLYRYAADLGDIDGLVQCHSYGIRCRRDCKRVAKYARIGASQNRSFSQHYLGTLSFSNIDRYSLRCLQC
jgi:TPR repeat protein